MGFTLLSYVMIKINCAMFFLIVTNYVLFFICYLFVLFFGATFFWT